MLLKKMTEQTYQEYVKLATKEYAEDKVKAGTWRKKEALSLAKESYQRLLPEGIQTKNHHLFSVFLEENQTIIGMIWLQVTDEKAFIYDFKIESDYQGNGYGTAVLSAITQWAKSKQMKEIGLHVFAHNQVAYNLYKKMGFLATDITMVKKISE